MNLNLILFVLLLPTLVADALLDVDYKWWRKWLGEQSRSS